MLESLLQKGVAKLRDISLNPQKEVMIWLSHLLKCDTLYIISNPQKPITNSIQQQFFKGIDRLCLHEPIEYLTNQVSFYSEQFFIDKGVLIPRPESELLIDHILQLQQHNTSYKPSHIAEIGVGSGVLSITLATKLQHCQFIGTDINKQALKITNHNAYTHKVQNRLSLYHTSYLDGICTQHIDILIANPPYIKEDYPIAKKLSYEPRQALFGGKKGDEVIKNIIDLAFNNQQKWQLKWLICEIGYDQQSSIQDYIQSLQQPYDTLNFYQDWSNFDRGFVLSFK